MTAPKKHLGDSHNFGRRVALHGKRVHKPRALLWEWLLLAADSPLRKLLDAEAAGAGWGRDAFAFLPALKFFGAKSGVGGQVQRVQLEPLARLTASDKHALALFSWLGVSDLHWENLVLGRDRKGRIVFGPLDIEMILADLSLPTETKLLPDADPEYAALCQHACGVRRVLPYLGKPVAAEHLLEMASAYRATLLFLEQHARAIARVISALPELRTTPIRVCLRSTEEYVRAGEDLWPPLLEAEAEQLARGDTPYFFRLYGRKGIHYYGNRALTELKRIPLRGDMPQLDPMLSLARGLSAASRASLREEGLFMLLGAFDHPALTGKHTREGLSVSFRARSLVVELPSGEELRSVRDLSGHVSSVYLPCRCGETASVFVPDVTVCQAR